MLDKTFDNGMEESHLPSFPLLRNKEISLCLRSSMHPDWMSRKQNNTLIGWEEKEEVAQRSDFFFSWLKRMLCCSLIG